MPSVLNVAAALPVFVTNGCINRFYFGLEKPWTGEDLEQLLWSFLSLWKGLILIVLCTSTEHSWFLASHHHFYQNSTVFLGALTTCKEEDELWRSWEGWWHGVNVVGKKAVKIPSRSSLEAPEFHFRLCGCVGKAADPGMTRGVQIQAPERLHQGLELKARQVKLDLRYGTNYHHFIPK